MITYRATLDVPTHTWSVVTRWITAHRRAHDIRPWQRAATARAQAMEWWLYTHCPTTGAPTALLTERFDKTAEQPEPEDTDEPTSDALYDTALTAEEGLWARSGWIGESPRV